MAVQGLHVAVVGYGTAGQTAAALLAADGHRVEVFEQAPTLGPVGAGFLLQPTGMQVLWEMGLLDQTLAHGRRIDRLYGETPCGRAVMDMRYTPLDRRLFGLGMQRGALFGLLAQAWSGSGGVHCGTRIMEISQDTRRVRDAQGSWHGPFDLVIAADGAASALRRHGGVRVDTPYPWGALWCLVPQDDWAWPHELRQRYVAARKMVGMLPVGTRPDDPQPQISFFWSLPADSFDAWERGGLAAWRDELAALWPQAAERLHGVQSCAQLARAGYRDAVLHTWHRDRLLLMGDAAHAMSPQLGQGVNMALMDAAALREALRHTETLPAALARYQQRRQRHVAIYQFWSRWLTPLFQSDRDTVARLRDVAFRPLGRVPGGRGHMLRVLSGTQHGMFGRLKLDPGFLQTLEGLATWPAPALPAAPAPAAID